MAATIDAASRQQWLDGLDEEAPGVVPALRMILNEQDISLVAQGNDLAPLADRNGLGQLRPGVHVGPYQLIEQIGVGGMGVVWRAERSDGMIKRHVALKLPGSYGHGDCLPGDRFHAECDILASLTHPHIARLYDAGRADGGRYYMALEYVEGVPVTEYVQRAALGLPERLHLFLMVLDAVRFAHERQVVHRDLKPSNILVSKDGQVHLLDFGIAALLTHPAAEGPRIDVNAMTPSYAAPEQVAGQPAGKESDVYSLGVMLYELLTQQRPYRIKLATRAAIEQAILHAEIPRASDAVLTVSGDLPGGARSWARRLRGDLDVILATALNRNASKRYPDAAMLAADLRRHLGGLPVLARPDAPLYRLAKFATRYRMAVALTAAVMLVLTAALGAVHGALREARNQERSAREQAQAIEAVVGFMEQLFSRTAVKLDAAVADSPETTSQLLDDGVRSMEPTLQQAPKVRLRLYRTLAQLYGDRRLEREAEELSARRLTLARQYPGPGNRELVDALLDRLSIVFIAPRDDDVDSMFRQASDIVGKLDGSDAKDLLRRGDLELVQAVALHQRDPAAGLGHSKKAVELLSQIEGRPPSYFEALNLRALYHVYEQQTAQALQVLDQLLAELPRGDSHRLDALASRCAVKVRLRRLKSAADDCRESARLAKLYYPPSGMRVAAGIDFLTSALVESGEYEEASSTMRTEVEVVKRSDEPEAAMHLASFFSKLMQIDILRGDLAGAERWLAEAARTGIPKPDGSDTAYLFMPLPSTALAMERGQLRRAGSTIQDALTKFESIGHGKGRQARQLRAAAVRLALFEGRPAEAEARLARDLPAPAPTNAEPVPDSELATAAVELERLALQAEIDVDLGRPDEATSVAGTLLERACGGDDAKAYITWCARAHTQLGRAALALGKLPAAERAFAAALSELDTFAAPNAPQRAEVVAWRGLARLAAGDRAAALAAKSGAQHMLEASGETAAYRRRPIDRLALALADPGSRARSIPAAHRRYRPQEVDPRGVTASAAPGPSGLRFGCDEAIRAATDRGGRSASCIRCGNRRCRTRG